jgi:hypothetical protein
MAEIPETTFLACQSLVALSATLNGAYFTYRLANDPGLKQIKTNFREAEQLCEEPTFKDNKVIEGEFQTIKNNYNAFDRHSETFYTILDGCMIWIGYTIALISIVLLVIITLRAEHHISFTRVITISFLLYLPISFCVISELVVNIRQSNRNKEITDFTERWQNHIRALGKHPAT